MRVDQPSALLIALYVRDVLGIPQTAAPVGLPRIDPAAGVPNVVVPSGEATCTGAWNRWWTRAMTTDPSVDVRSAAFVSDDPLAAAIDRLSGPAITWSQAHRETARDGIHRQALRQGSVLQTHLSRRGPIAAFTLRILVLPVDSYKVWPVRPELVIVPDRLFTAQREFDSHLLDVIETLSSP